MLSIVRTTASAWAASIIIWVLFSFTVVPFLLIVNFFRFLLSVCVTLFNSKVGGIVERGSAIFRMTMPENEIRMAIIFGVEGKLELEEVREAFYSRVVLKRNARGRLMRPELQQFLKPICGFSFWHWEEPFDIRNHVNVLDVDPVWNQKEKTVNEIAEIVEEKVLRKPWSKEQSPWELIVIENFRDTPVFSTGGEGYLGTILVFKVHHVLGDGTCFREICHDLFGYHATEIGINPVTQKSSQSNQKYGLYGMLKTYFFGPWSSLLMEKREKLANKGYRVGGGRLKNKFNIGVTPVVPLELIKRIRKSQGVSYTATLLTVLSRAYVRFLRAAGHEPTKQLICVCTRGVPNHPGGMGNNITVVHSEVTLDMDAPGAFKANEMSLQADIDSTNPQFTFVCTKILGSLPDSWRNKAIRGFDGGYCVFTNSPFAEKDVYFGEGKNRLRTVFGFGLADTDGSGHGMIYFSASCKDGVRLVLQLDESIVSREELHAEKFVQYFMEELVKWSGDDSA